MTRLLRKAVFPVAGLGTRFLPATKAIPKEMLPVVDKPIMQYAVEEAVEAGITELIFVTGRTKRSIEDHFDRSPELEAELAERGKTELLDAVRSLLPSRVNCIYIRQPEPLGLGHAVLCARPAVGDEPFVVALPDDLIYAPDEGCIAQMAAVFGERGGSVVAVEDVPASQTDQYGIVNVDDASRDTSTMRAIVEKPAPDVAPSTLGVVGRYVLTPGIFDLLESTPRGAGGEIQLTDAIAALLTDEPVFAYRFGGRRFDCGKKLGFLEATVHLALARDDLGTDFRRVLESVQDAAK